MFVVSPAAGQGSVAITEFMASNATTLADDMGSFSDWIELHNSGREAVDLTGWFLTDNAQNLTKWEFPERILEPGEFLLVFASGQAEAEAGGPLNTHFRLAAQGEYLALVAADGATVVSEFGPVYPSQTTDVSFGRELNSGRVGYFNSPTPGEANGTITGLGKTVTLSRQGGTFFDSIDLTFSADLDEGQEIQYSTNGQVPTLFNGNKAKSGDTITITTNTHIRAHIKESSGGLSGPFANAIFVKLNKDLRNFSSNLPLVFIDTVGTPIPGTASPTLAGARAVILETETESGRTLVEAVPHHVGKCGLRIRGRSSAGFPKKQYKFEFWDEGDREREVDLLGMGDESDWVLSAPYTDKSLMRNVLTYRLWEAAGWPSVETRFVEVFLNEDGAAELSFNDHYLGVYVFMESITIDDDRFDMEPPEETTDPEEITGGYIMESGNPGGSHFTTRTSKKSIPYRHKDPNVDNLNSQQRAWIQDRIEAFEEALFSDNFRHPQTGQHYSELTDVASQVDYRIYREWTRNFDGGSTYFTLPRGGVITMGPLWDYNWALGNVNYAEGGDDPGYVIEGWNRSFTSLPAWPSWPLRLEQDPDFWQRFTERWFELREDLLATENVNHLIDDIATLLEESAERNFNRWKVLGTFTVISPPGFRERTTYQSEVDYLKDWLEDRMAWMDSAFPQKPSLSQDSGPIEPNFMLNMASPDGPVYYTTNGSDPRASGGFPSPDARQFEGGPVDAAFVPRGAAVRYSVPENDSLGEEWRQPDFDDSAWKSAPGPLGFETPDGLLEAAIVTDIREDMHGVNASIYTRYSFSFDNDPSNANALRMVIHYDDAFVAWLNGVEIARDSERAPAEIAWDSFAVASRSDDDAIKDFVIDLPAPENLLRRGNNVLAIQAMNTAAGSSDVLIGASLEGNHSVSAAPLELNESTLITARTRQGDQWSVPVKAYFSVDEIEAADSNLVVSEIMYHPAEPSEAEKAAGFSDQEQFEFIELYNPGPRAVTLFDVAFTEGIDFDFSQSFPPRLGPGRYAVLVSDQAAFQTRYGAGIHVLGQYTANLSNSGELVELTSNGTVILSIDFDDQWHPSTDGDGYSLVLKDENQVPTDWNVAGTWRAGSVSGGTPGSAEETVSPSQSYAEWQAIHFSSEELQDTSISGFAADPDGDLLSNLVEYGTGSDPRSGVIVQPPLSVSRDGATALHVEYRKSATADEILYAVEMSSDLVDWTVLPETAPDEIDNGDGTRTVRWLAESADSFVEQYFRLRLTRSE